MDLDALRTEFAARGFDYLSTTRKDYFLNRAYQEVCEEEEWPFLEATSTGAAPLTISDLRTIESVIDTTQTVKLVPLDRRHLTDLSADLTITGSPTWYYVSNTNIVSVYPVATNDLSVRYWKAPSDLTAGGDSPLLPSRFHYSLIDGACAYAYFDSDNFEAATQCLQLWADSKLRMRESLLNRQADRPDDFVVNTYAHLDAG